MALPTTATDSRPALSYEELISELNTPRQEFEPAPGATDREPVSMPGDRSKIDPNGAEKVSAETAAAAGKQIAGLVVNGSQALCGFIGGEKGEKYKVTKAQESDLAESYAKVAAHYNMSETNPMIAAVILSLVILGPGFKDAFSDRRIKKLEEEQQLIQAEQKRQAIEMQKMRDFIEKEKANGQQPATA